MNWQAYAIIVGWALTLIAGAYKLGGIHTDVKRISDDYDEIRSEVNALKNQFIDLLKLSIVGNARRND